MKKSLREAIEPELDDQIEDLSEEPEYRSLRLFKEFKLDDESYHFNFIELNALARGLWREIMDEDDHLPPENFISNLKNELIQYGFEFVPRKIVKLPRSGKGSHGTHPFAGSGGGGSGFGVDGKVGGRGPGNMGGGYDWDPSDKKNLPMGAKKK